MGQKVKLYSTNWSKTIDIKLRKQKLTWIYHSKSTSTWWQRFTTRIKILAYTRLKVIFVRLVHLTTKGGKTLQLRNLPASFSKLYLINAPPLIKELIQSESSPRTTRKMICLVPETYSSTNFIKKTANWSNSWNRIRTICYLQFLHHAYRSKSRNSWIISDLHRLLVRLRLPLRQIVTFRILSRSNLAKRKHSKMVY